MLIEHGSEIREATASYRSGRDRYMNILVWKIFCSIGDIEPSYGLKDPSRCTCSFLRVRLRQYAESVHGCRQAWYHNRHLALTWYN